MCKTQNDVFNIADTCIAYSGGNYTIGTCPKGYYCPSEHEERNQTCTPGFHSEFVHGPGEPCKENAQCTSKVCDNGACQGKTQGQNCNYNIDCNPGLYCENGSCEKQKDLEEDCSNDEECINSARCNKEPGEEKGECMEYLSLKPNMTVSSCYNRTNWLCESTFCSELENPPRCGSPPKSYMEPPVPCASDGDCYSEIDPLLGVGYEGKCSCSYSEGGNSYCGVYSGDPVGSRSLKLWKKWYGSEDVNNCNTARRNNLECIVNVWNDTQSALELKYFDIWQKEFAHVQENRECVKEVYTWYFWNAKLAFDTYGDKDGGEQDDYNFSSLLSLSLGLLWLI